MTALFYISVILSCVLAYLLGSVNFALVVSRSFLRKDIRRYGSKSAGMTNMLRTFGKLPALITLVGDFVKGILAILIGHLIIYYLGGVPSFPLCDGLVGVSALLGHVFPVYYHFKGGKGILVSAGIILMLNPWIFLIILATFLLFFALSRIVSLGSVAACIMLPVATALMGWMQRQNMFDWISSTAVALVIAGITLYKHRANIKRLWKGEEPKIGQKSKK